MSGKVTAFNDKSFTLALGDDSPRDWRGKTVTFNIITSTRLTGKPYSTVKVGTEILASFRASDVTSTGAYPAVQIAVE